LHPTIDARRLKSWAAHLSPFPVQNFCQSGGTFLRLIPGGSVTGNNKVWRKFTFSPITTNKMRVWINTVPDAWSRVVEI
jgi:RHS repeat-associated protein